MAKKAETTAESIPIRTRIQELQERRRAGLARILELEAAGASASAPAGNPTHTQALALLTGTAAAVPVEADLNAELFALYQEQHAIDRALHIGGLQELQERGESARALMAAESTEWRAAVRKRVLLAIALQKANREFEVFKRRYAAVGGLPGAQFKLLGLGVGADEVRACSEQMVAIGILTSKEAFDE